MRCCPPRVLRRPLLLLAGAVLLPCLAGAETSPRGALGEVRSIDADKGRLTLRHGRIEHLDMPPMTMSFSVADPSWLGRFKAGDRVRFRADRVGGAFVVTGITSDR